MVTSPLPEEGKTTVVSNIAIALAEMNRPVLAIDADMRKPRLHEIFDVPNTWGLSDPLAGRNSLNGCPREAFARETEISARRAQRANSRFCRTRNVVG